MSSPLLKVDKVTKRFGGLAAVSDVNLYINSGELVGLIGPNGAGKTTLLDLICGKTKATAGSIQFKDIELTKMSEHQIVHSGVGRKFQTPSIYEALTVFENLELALRTQPSDRQVWPSMRFKLDSAQSDRLAEVLVTIHLAESVSRLAGNLSHGQKQWLEIGMLLMQEP